MRYVAQTMADGFTQTLHGLIRKRSEIANEMAGLRHQMERLTAQMDALDQSIRIFSPQIDFESLPGPKLPRLAVAFRGEVLRHCADLFRQAEGPLTTEDVAVAVMRARGLDVANADLKRTMVHRIGSTLRKMREKGFIRDCGRVEGGNMNQWELVPLE